MKNKIIEFGMCTTIVLIILIIIYFILGIHCCVIGIEYMVNDSYIASISFYLLAIIIAGVMTFMIMIFL